MTTSFDTDGIRHDAGRVVLVPAHVLARGLNNAVQYTGMFNTKLQEWEDYYNYHRPHGSLGGRSPYERLKQKTQAPT